MMTTNHSRTRRVLAGLALAAGAAAAYGISASARDFAPTPEDEHADDHVGLGPQRDGVYLAGID